MPPYDLILLTLSKRLHSIYTLRLFNDGVTMLFFYAFILAWTSKTRHWMIGTILYRFAITLILLPSFHADESMQRTVLLYLLKWISCSPSQRYFTSFSSTSESWRRSSTFSSSSSSRFHLLYHSYLTHPNISPTRSIFHARLTGLGRSIGGGLVKKLLAVGDSVEVYWGCTR